MSTIKVLDHLTIQKIAAGEVIERPSSIVKELIENSLDANARTIVIEIEKGGKSLIRVTDDGDGIREEEISLAFKRHSTSKLRNIDDIYKLFSLGFRGEALASISTVSKVEVLTKTQNAQGGIHVNVEDGDIVSQDRVGCPKGTTMIIRDLFYNLPVRKKFLRTDNTEANHISDLINKLALGNPHVSFRFIKDKKTVLKTSGNKNLLSTIHTILGKDYTKNLVPLYHKDDYIEVNGYISNNNLYRANRNHQYLFINNRNITNHNIVRIVESAYKSLIPIGRFPIYILNIKIDPGEIDINVHPTKQEVKFVNGDQVFSRINNIINNSINDLLRVPKLRLENNIIRDNENKLPKLFINDEIEKNNNIVIHDYTQENYEGFQEDVGENIQSIVTPEYNFLNNLEKREIMNEDSKNKINNREENSLDYSSIEILPLGVVFATYIIVEVEGENKILFIDQHAAHERIMYEKYKKEYENEQVHSQILLAPEVIELTNVEMNSLNENIGLFNKLGFDLEEFGPKSIVIRAVPLVFGKPQVRDLFLDLLDSLKDNIKTSYDMKADKIMKIACTKAIKAGDKIGSREITALFKDLLRCDNPLTCPHGRPTIIELTKRDIEKQFLRIM